MRKWEVDLTLIEAWIDTLDDEEYDNVIAALEQLEEHGPVTRRPFVDTLEGSEHPNMKELRPRATKGGAHIRGALTPCVGHAESRKIGGGSEMIHHDGKEKLPGRVQAGRGSAVP
ncbi:type II toxin-antitoxin system RelE/ParE family toxin, partial [Mycobacterium attenuatum]|uniref:type II toxin-antitoxin system RelE/ParE family toxin n=1 Tax=Mycobacterium attenuatum TaxID=2341086 RepID=UPI001FCF1E98